MTFETLLDTARIQLDHITSNDAGFFVKLMNSEGWLKNIGDRNVRTSDQAQEYLTNCFIKAYQELGFGYYVVRLKSCSTPIGICGFLKKPDLSYPDFGYAFLPSYQGKGYAHEACSELLTFAIDAFQLPVIDAVSLPQNAPSIRLLKKLGFQYIGLHQANSDSPLSLYRLSIK